MGIDTPKLVLKVRELAAEKGVLPPTLQRMAEGILERGTPYLEG